MLYNLDVYVCTPTDHCDGVYYKHYIHQEKTITQNMCLAGCNLWHTF